MLLDLRMPGEDGMALLEELAPRAPRQVCIVVSGVDEIPVAVEALKAGAYDYVLKPFSASELQIAVGRTLKRRQMELAERERRERTTLRRGGAPDACWSAPARACCGRCA